MAKAISGRITSAGVAGLVEELGPLGSRRPAWVPEFHRSRTAQAGGVAGYRRCFRELRPAHHHRDGGLTPLTRCNGFMVDSGEGRDTDPPERRYNRRGAGEFIGMVFHGQTINPHRRDVPLLVEWLDVQRRAFQPDYLSRGRAVPQYRGSLRGHHHEGRAARTCPGFGAWTGWTQRSQ